MAKTIKLKKLRLGVLFIVSAILLLSIPSCFNKELKQDRRLAEYRHQIIHMYDSLITSENKIKGFDKIIENIEADEYLIAPRKRDLLLIEVNTFLCNEYLKLADYANAISRSDIIIHLDSLSPKGYYIRGCIYQTIENDSLAISDYTQAIKLEGSYTDAYYNRGIVYEKLGENELALYDYNKAIKQNPSYLASVYNNRGNIFFAKEEFSKAIDDYTKVINLDSANISAYSNRADVYIALKDYEKAIDDCEKIIEMDSLSINAFLKRASVYELQREYKEAVEDYEYIMELDPDSKHPSGESVKESLQKIKPLMKGKG